MASIISERTARDEDEDELPPAKRQKIGAACDQCRSKKIKCDGTKPVCAPCIRRNGPFSVCKWGVRKGRGTAITKNEQLLRLTQRIEELEREKSLASVHGVDANATDSSIQSSVPEDRPCAELATSSHGGESRIVLPLSPEPENSPIREGSTTEPAMVTTAHQASTTPHDPGVSRDIDRETYNESNAMMGFVENADQLSPAYHNDSSAIGFVNHIKRILDGESESSGSLATSPQPRLPRNHYRQRQPVDYVLPSRQRADHLLVVYRRLVFNLYPFLDFEEIETLYQRLWTGEELGPDSLTFVCLINVAFSLASNLDNSVAPQDRNATAEIFYNRAQELLPSSRLHDPSLLQVQCFLLLGQYLQSSNDPEQCWIFVGHAIRIAQSLKLDLPSTSTREPLYRREAMRRIWHGCVLMDRTLSMTFGRPPMIPCQAMMSVPLPLPHLDPSQCLCSTQILSGSDGTDYHFFIETLKLYHLMNQALQIQYNSDADAELRSDPNLAYFGVSGAKVVADILELDHKLSSWYQALPHHLRKGTMAGKHPIHHRQSNIITIRYNHVRILLFRPILTRYCSQNSIPIISSTSGEDHLAGKFALQCSVECVRASFQVIRHFDVLVTGQRVEDFDEILPAWWYSIFYVYTAATVLVAARLIKSLLRQVTEHAVHQSWTTATQILSRFEAFGQHARRCSTAIAILLDQVVQQSNHHENTPGYEGHDKSVSPLVVSAAQGTQLSQSGPPATLGGGVHTNNWALSGRELELLRRPPPTVENVVRHFNTSGIQVDDFWDMSWLKGTGMPSRLH